MSTAFDVKQLARIGIYSTSDKTVSKENLFSFDNSINNKILLNKIAIAI